jgi:hypothetical protein
MAIDELNRNGIEDFPDYSWPFLQSESGQKPMITYSVHINPDLPDEGYVQKFRIYGFPEGIRFTADNWTSMNSVQQGRILRKADAMADELILGSSNVFMPGSINVFQKPMPKCRVCRGPAVMLLRCGKSTTRVPRESVFVSRTAAFPVCGSVPNSPCHMKGRQLMDHWLRIRDGDEETDDVKRECANCGKREPKPGTYKRCGKCRIEYYCSRECQETHWRSGEHKDVCTAWTHPTNNNYNG